MTSSLSELSEVSRSSNPFRASVMSSFSYHRCVSVVTVSGVFTAPPLGVEVVTTSDLYLSARPLRIFWLSASCRLGSLMAVSSACLIASVCGPPLPPSAFELFRMVVISARILLAFSFLASMSSLNRSNPPSMSESVFSTYARMSSALMVARDLFRAVSMLLAPAEKVLAVFVELLIEVIGRLLV